MLGMSPGQSIGYPEIKAEPPWYSTHASAAAPIQKTDMSNDGRAARIDSLAQKKVHFDLHRVLIQPKYRYCPALFVVLRAAGSIDGEPVKDFANNSIQLRL